jgi:hypothetical protein
VKRSRIGGTAILLFWAVVILPGCRSEVDAGKGVSSGGPVAAAPGSTAGAVSPPAAPLPPGLVAPPGYPYRGKPIYAVGNRPVTEEELRRYSKRMLGMGEHAKHPDFDPDKVIQSFARYWAVVEWGIEKGVGDSPQVRNLNEVYRMAALANDYRARVERSLSVSDDAIRSSIPSDWTRMEFSVLTFPDPAGAETFFREAKRKKEALGKAEFAGFVEEKFKSRTGKIFRGSGFFTEAEEPYLFSLKEGEISRPVDTGIGKGVCYVMTREFLEGKAREAYLEEARARVRAQEVDARFKAIVSKARYTVHRDNVAQGVRIEGVAGTQADLTVLTLQDPGGGIRLSYRDFRTLNGAHYSVMFRTTPPESWPNLVSPEVENLAHLYAVGNAAAKENAPVDPRWETELFDFRGKSIYQATLDRLAAESTPSVTDAEVERFYKTNRGFFDRKESARIRYVYAPEREALESLARQAGGDRKRIFTEKEYAHLVKSRDITKDDPTFGGLFKALSGVNAGGISGVVKAGMGYYIARVDERRPKGFLPFREVRAEIRNKLLTEKRQEKAREAMNARMATVPIRKL